jgi:hypothetical protein
MAREERGVRSGGRGAPGGAREERGVRSGGRGAREVTSSSTGHRYVFSGPLIIVSGISGASGVSGISGNERSELCRASELES